MIAHWDVYAPRETTWRPGICMLETVLAGITARLDDGIDQVIRGFAANPAAVLGHVHRGVVVIEATRKTPAGPVSWRVIPLPGQTLYRDGYS